MRARQVWVAGAVLALSVLAGCGDGAPQPAPSWAVPEVSQPPGQEAAPLSDAEEAYLQALAAIDEQVADDEDAVFIGRHLCTTIERKKTGAHVTKTASVRFNVDNATAKKIVKATRSTLCTS